MQIFKGLKEFNGISAPVVTTGTFDGVHLGHQHIIQRTKREAAAIGGEDLLITFWPHPRHVVEHKDKDVRLLNSLEEKIRIFEEKGVSNLLLIDFTEKFARIQPHIFINEVVVEMIKARVIVIGYDHRFGHKRTGSFSFLRENEHIGNYRLVEVPALEVNGSTVSSTKIRNALNDGNVELANTMLGYNYQIDGTVVEGMKLGQSIGFPTANILISHPYKLLPKDGVYVCSIEVSGKRYNGMLNIGFNPTVSGKGWSFEVNIFDFDRDIYGEKARVEFLKRIRDEKKYNSLEALKQQIQLDLEFSLAYFKQKS